MKKARSRETVYYRILERDEEIMYLYEGIQTFKKGMYQIHDGFHVPFFLTRKAFLERYEPLE